ncbi:undecaprenyldiphospho-muramoylpentapeptide beta-N-acetylglucosaminyltransferase [Boudabousia liubingyangii]|uniref:undecaprenyldiphospho-muramoylpentapeptide beta-N-acetylglucosaminyltransferase n=1 Tax=Boudabousia liubingyangii TaxID=1921764 RepID=UPI00093E88E0|nr:undecaprenyldiphospho-muramoylpentapeptide beta-N-acetylglucosaminyltransferase [Boudabousia liubingyangii]OKL47544.1 undecaprenyldiphospho-muramoylpentapeptide beta-N-acetylglucosaminyltransferase [Boudabousia liubingyangii]
MRVYLAGGGSAGHVNPLLATATELQARGHEVRALGTAEGLEADLVPAAGLELDFIPKVAFPRRPGLAMFKFPRAFKNAVKQAGEYLDSFGAEVVVGFGGYVSTPAYRAAQARGIPVVIQEQNVRAGLANRWGARTCAALGLSFPATTLRAKRGKTAVVGLPLRAPIAQLAEDRLAGNGDQRRESAVQTLGLDPNLPTLVITGGSLGAKHLNDAFAQVLPELPEGIQVYHLTGKGKSAELAASVEKLGLADRYHVSEYAMNMEEVLAAADLVVCRSGAGTVCELAALGLPALYVPLPIGNGEQRLNAAEVVGAGGAKLVLDAQFDADVIRKEVFPWILDEAKLQAAATAAAGCGRVHASARFVDLIEQVKND